MLTLKVDEIPEEGLDLVWREERDSLLNYFKKLSATDIDFETSLQSDVKIRKVSQAVLIRGKIQTDLRLRCVRCLKEFSYPLSSPIELILYPLEDGVSTDEKELDKTEMESNYFEGGEIHLSEIACEQIFLEIPYQPLCHEACKGLCPECGKDLNLSSCECVKGELTSGFSVLQKLKLG